MIVFLVLPFVFRILPALAMVQATTLEQSSGRMPGTMGSCSIEVVPPHAISLENGASVTVNATSIAVNAKSVFIAGTPTNVWAPGAGAGASPIAGVPSIGVVRDSDGLVRLVPSPTGHPDAGHPRVASAGSEGWHVLFVTGKRGGIGGPLQFDGADLWYGKYDGRRWSDIIHITEARFANLLPGRSSGLITTHDGLAYAYSFDNLAASTGATDRRRGLVMLRRHGRQWSADTLPTWEGASSVQLVERTDREVLAVYTQAYFANRRPRSRSLFLARYNAGWQSPILLLDPSPREVVNVAIGASDGEHTVLSWDVASMEPDYRALEWGVLNVNGTLVRKGTLAHLLPIDQPAAVAFDESRTIWFTRSGVSRDSVRVLVAPAAATVFELATVRVPLDNYVIVGAQDSSGRIILVTGGLGPTERDPPASTLLTEFSVDCSPTPQL